MSVLAARDVRAPAAQTGVASVACAPWPDRRILHVVAPGEFGGVSTVVRQLTTAQRAAGRDVRVALFLNAPAHPVAAALADVGIPVIALIAPVRAYHRQRRLLAECCRAVRPDVLHTHGYHADVLSAPVGRALGIPTAMTLHGFTGGDWKNRTYEWLQRRTARRAGAVVAVSRPLAESLAEAGVSRSRLHVVPNAIGFGTPPAGRGEARAALGLSEHGFRLGWVGRLSREKGLDVFLHALAALGEPQVALSVLGAGPDAESLCDLTAALGIGGSVWWHGPVADAAHLLRAFDAVVLSSRTEGTPMIMLEAMAAGVPVVATSVGGVPDLAGDAALLVPPEDPAALARALRVLLESPGLRRRLAEAGARRATTEYATPPWVERYDLVYASLAPSYRIPS